MPRVEAYELLAGSERRVIDRLKREGSSIPKNRAAFDIWQGLTEFERMRRIDEYATQGMVSESPEAQYRAPGWGSRAGRR